MFRPWYYYGDLRYAGRTFHFVFRFVYTATAGWRAFIDEAPRYEGRSEGAGPTHRLIDNGRHYICWSTRVDSKSAMESIADLWAKATVMYIVHGGSSITDYVTRIQAGNS